ncbi:hypothetical protein D9M70_543770 [compost metagenome]
MHVGAHHRLQGSIDAAGRGPPEFSRNRVEPVRERERHAGKVGMNELRDPQFVCRIHDRPQQAYRNGFDPCASHLIKGSEEGGLVQWLQLRAVSQDAARDFPGERPWHKRIGVRHREVERLQAPPLP